jgi:lipopolysaccharide transport system permease protein
MNPHARQPISPLSAMRSMLVNRGLIYSLAKREILGRYRGSALGLAWSFFNPVLMLTVYTFFFAVVFKSRWGTAGSDSKTEFAVILFVGMIIHGLFAEILNRAPRLIIDNVNYVKKVVFPIEVLPAVSICVALFHAAVSLIVLLLAFLVFNGFLQWTAIFVPLVVLPLIILSFGVAWFLASLGVYLRDVSQTMGLLTAVLMFLSPVFYPVTSLPESVRPWIMANPLTFIIEQSRDVLIWGKLPNFSGIAIYAAIATVIAWLGYAWFQKTKGGFADVL